MASETQIIIADYLDSSAGAAVAEHTLRAAGIPYELVRASGTWSGVVARMEITVPSEWFDTAVAALKNASSTGILIAAQPEEGLHQW
jgi:hypothetical protein